LALLIRLLLLRRLLRLHFVLSPPRLVSGLLRRRLLLLLPLGVVVLLSPPRIRGLLVGVSRAIDKP
jgi:hypothetical protein